MVWKTSTPSSVSRARSAATTLSAACTVCGSTVATSSTLAPPSTTPASATRARASRPLGCAGRTLVAVGSAGTDGRTWSVAAGRTPRVHVAKPVSVFTRLRKKRKKGGWGWGHGDKQTKTGKQANKQASKEKKKAEKKPTSYSAQRSFQVVPIPTLPNVTR